MSVIPLTLTVSLLLVGLFLLFFLREQTRSRLSSAERDALLPLAEETPRLVARRELAAKKPVVAPSDEPTPKQFLG